MKTLLLFDRRLRMAAGIFLLLIGYQGLASNSADGCAGTGSSQIICGATGPIAIAQMISGETSGGSWWMTAYGSGGLFNSETGVFTPDELTQGIFMFSYYFSEDESCGNDSTTVTLTFVSGDAVEDREGHSCQGDSAMFDLNNEIMLTAAGQQGGGTWTRTNGTGGVFDAAAGTFDCTPEASSSTFVYTANGACGTFTCTFNVYRAGRPVPGAGQDGEMAHCEGTSAIINLHDIISGEEIYNPLWTRISGTGGELDPLTGIFTATPETTTSVFRYRMASGAGMCGNDTSFATLTVSSCAAADEACGAIYWKENASAWCDAYNGSTALSSIFNVPPSMQSKSLMQVLNFKGNGPHNLARQAVTALLNICSADVNYPMPYGNSVHALVTAVNSAFAANGNAINSLASELSALNAMDCPLESSRPGTAEVVLLPNPFSDRLNISVADYQGRATIEIFDILGRLMSTRITDISQVNAPVEFTTGFTPVTGQLYFIKIKTSHGISVIKSVGK